MEAECVCIYVSNNVKIDSLPVPSWRVDMSLHVSKRLKHLSAVAVEGGIVRKIFKIQ